MFDQRTMHGAYFALAAYGFWGVAPIYFKLLGHVSPIEILCHRVIWSVFLLLGILAYTGQLAALRVTRRQLGLCLVTAILLSINWLIFIDAIISNNIVEASLGYFINPLVNVFLGMLFLREYLRPLQWVAISIAALGIGFQVFTLGALPWVSLALAFSFGFYGLIRKFAATSPCGWARHRNSDDAAPSAGLPRLVLQSGGREFCAYRSFYRCLADARWRRDFFSPAVLCGCSGSFVSDRCRDVSISCPQPDTGDRHRYF